MSIIDSTKEYILVYNLRSHDNKTAVSEGTIVTNVRTDRRDSGYLFDVNGKTYSTYYQCMLAENTEENLEIIKNLHSLQEQRDRLKKEIEDTSRKLKLVPLPEGRTPDFDDDKEDE